MIIGYLVPEFPGQTHAFFWRELTAMEEAGQTVCLYSTRHPAPGTCPHTFAPQATARTTYLFPPRAVDAFELLRLPGRTARAAAYVAGLRQTSPAGRARILGLLPSAARLVADARARGVSHIHIHSCANAAHLGALANILGDLPYSLTLHGDLPVYGTDHGAKFSRARFVSAVTRPLAAQIREVSPTTDAPVIWMGVDTNRFVPIVRPANSVFTVATIARLNHAKGHRFFLRAMAELRRAGIDIRYQIAGDGPEKATIQAEIARLALGDRVEMLGALNEEGVLALLQGSDALALTSIGKGEAAPVTLMEAMSCGLPVIASIIGGTPDMIEDDCDGLLVPQEDVGAIVTALRGLIIDPARAARIGQAARESAQRKFDRQINARKLLERIKAG